MSTTTTADPTPSRLERHGFLRERVAGRPLRWARDLAFVGGITSGFAPWMARGLSPAGYEKVSLGVGILTGALLGLMMPALLDRVRGRVPLPLLVLCAPLTGIAWGGLTGALAGFPFGPSNTELGFWSGAAAGMVQFGWFWFPYTFQSVRRGRTWPVLLGSVLMLPLATVAGVWVGFVVALSGGPF